MSVPTPHFLLFSESNKGNERGEWKFVLQAADGSATFEARDQEPEVRGERLELLAVVRGLEALNQPSRVTLVAPGKYVHRGLTYGLAEWRRNGWTWECFGQMVPVKNRDLWQRLDRASRIHRVRCAWVRFDDAEKGVPNAPHFLRRKSPGAAHANAVPQRPKASATSRIARWASDHLERARLHVSQLGTAVLPSPWLG